MCDETGRCGQGHARDAMYRTSLGQGGLAAAHPRHLAVYHLLDPRLLVRAAVLLYRPLGSPLAVHLVRVLAVEGHLHLALERVVHPVGHLACSR